MSQAKVSQTEFAKCSLCGTARADHELNGVNPLAPLERRYERAFCIHIDGCDSQDVKGQNDPVNSKATRVTLGA